MRGAEGAWCWWLCVQAMEVRRVTRLVVLLDRAQLKYYEDSDSTASPPEQVTPPAHRRT